MDKLMNVLNYSPKVNPIRAPSELHLDWDNYFEKLYKRPASGTVTQQRRKHQRIKTRNRYIYNTN